MTMFIPVTTPVTTKGKWEVIGKMHGGTILYDSRVSGFVFKPVTDFMHMSLETLRDIVNFIETKNSQLKG